MEKLNVLSLFDGVSCGRVALERAGIKVNKYYASEINEKAITVAKHNYPDIIHLGDVEKVDSDTIASIGKIDLLIGGSPCQGLSRSKSNRKNLDDPRSKLFFEYVRILNYIQNNINPDVKFLLENVVPDKETESIMTETVGVDPVRINSNLFSAQNRDRLYWTNIPVDTLPIENSLTIADIIYDNTYKVTSIAEKYWDTVRESKNYIKWDTGGKGHYSQANRAYYQHKKMGTLPESRPSSKMNIHLGGYEFRRIHPIEAERLQTLPDDYTKVVATKNDDVRCGLVGNGWTVEVIAHIFKGLKKDLHIGNINPVIHNQIQISDQQIELN